MSLGVVRRRSVDLLAVSGFDQVSSHHPGVRLIADAMNECLDAQDVICVQRDQGDDDSGASGHRLHVRWHRETGLSAVATIPVEVDGEIAAVVAFRNPADRPIARDRLEQVQKSIAQLAPGLALLRRADRSLWRHAGESLRRFVVGGTLLRRAALMGGVCGAAWLAFGKTHYVVTVPCELAAAERRIVSAPFEGVLAAVHVRPGDHVTAGELLAELDSAPLAAEQVRLQAERDVAQVALANASRNRDPRRSCSGAGAPRSGPRLNSPPWRTNWRTPNCERRATGSSSPATSSPASAR